MVYSINYNDCKGNYRRISNQIPIGWCNQRRSDEWSMQELWVRWKIRTGFWWRNLKERAHLEGLGIIGRLILMNMKEIGWKGLDWIKLTQNWSKWQPVVIAGMKLWVL